MTIKPAKMSPLAQIFAWPLFVPVFLVSILAVAVIWVTMLPLALIAVLDGGRGIE